jgi:hypothetical protein
MDGDSLVKTLFSETVRVGWQFQRQHEPQRSSLRGNPPPAQQGEPIAATFQRWRRQIEDYERGQWEWSQQHPLWRPMRPGSEWNVLPVFGGTSIGWEALLATLGASLLGSGRSLSVLNFSDRATVSSISELAAAHGLQAWNGIVTSGGRSLDLFAGLGGDALVDLVLDSLATADPREVRRDHIEDRSLLRTIAAKLRPPVTLQRLRTALGVVLREDVASDQKGRLADDEFDAVSELYGDAIRQHTDILVRAYQLERSLDELSAFETTSGPPRVVPPSQGLAIVEVDPALEEANFDLAVDLTIQSFLRSLASTSANGGRRVLVIAGADRLRPGTLRRLLAVSERHNVSTVLLFSRLRDVALEALGESDTMLFMRLTDHREARVAADQIGRQHKFVYSSVTRTRSESFDQSRGTSRGSESGTSRGTSVGGQFSASFSTNQGSSLGSSTNQSIGTSVSEGIGHERVYEYQIEPSVLQGLEHTALFLVEHAAGASRLGDCDPTILMLPRVEPG